MVKNIIYLNLNPKCYLNLIFNNLHLQNTRSQLRFVWLGLSFIDFSFLKLHLERCPGAKSTPWSTMLGPPAPPTICMALVTPLLHGRPTRLVSRSSMAKTWRVRKEEEEEEQNYQGEEDHFLENFREN